MGVNHPFIAAPLLQNLPYYNTIARPLRNIRPPHRTLLCMPYAIQYWRCQYRVKARLERCLTVCARLLWPPSMLCPCPFVDPISRSCSGLMVDSRGFCAPPPVYCLCLFVDPFTRFWSRRTSDSAACALTLAPIAPPVLCYVPLWTRVPVSLLVSWPTRWPALSPSPSLTPTLMHSAFTRYSFAPTLSCTSQSSVYCPLHLHCSHHCNTIARPMRNIRPLTRPPLCMPYTIQYWQWQYRVKANSRARSRPRSRRLSGPTGHGSSARPRAPELTCTPPPLSLPGTSTWAATRWIGLTTQKHNNTHTHISAHSAGTKAWVVCVCERESVCAVCLCVCVRCVCVREREREREGGRERAVYL